MNLLKGFLWRCLLTLLLMAGFVCVFTYLAEAKDTRPKITLVKVTGVLYKLAPYDESTGWLLELEKPLRIGLRTKKYVIELQPGTGDSGFGNMFEKYKYWKITVTGALKTLQGKYRGEYYVIGVSEVRVGD